MFVTVRSSTLRALGAFTATLSMAVFAVAQQTTPTQTQQPTTPTQTQQPTSPSQSKRPSTSTPQSDTTQSDTTQPSTTQSGTTQSGTTQPSTASDSSAAGASTQTATAGGDIVETATKAGSFNTLIAAIEAAGLTETLKGAGPYTVFAPTDEAFAKLPAGTLDELLKPENKEKLKSLLSYHVVPGNVKAADVAKMNGKTAKTVQGGTLSINTAEGVKVGNATVKQTDIVASNGVIHVIDSVLMPSSSGGSTKSKP